MSKIVLSAEQRYGALQRPFFSGIIKNADRHRSMKSLRLYNDGLREFVQFRFQPSMDLLVVLVSFLSLIITLYYTWKLFTITSVLVPLSMFILGVLIPILYNSFVKDQPLSEIGIRKTYWQRSLVLGFILSILIVIAPVPPGLTATTTTFIAAVKDLTFIELLPLLALEITAGLFWTIFFCGWIQLRFERAFGAIPAILVAAALFALHHAGYGETISPSHMVPLFMAGIVNSTIFRITRNILILWPFFIAKTGLSSDLLQWNLRLPFESTYTYFGVLILMWLSIAVTHYQQKKAVSSQS